MRTTNTRIAAAVTVLASGGLSAAVLQPGSGSRSASNAALQQPAVEVRTQVIRRTIHVVRHERPPRAQRPHGEPSGARGSAAGSGSAGGAVAPGAGAAAVRTASSGSHANAGAGVGVSAPSAAPAPRVRTRTSGASRGGSTSGGATSGGGAKGAPVRTRTSGGSHHDDGGEHDD